MCQVFVMLGFLHFAKKIVISLLQEFVCSCSTSEVKHQLSGGKENHRHL